jgi:carbon storage regulator
MLSNSRTANTSEGNGSGIAYSIDRRRIHSSGNHISPDSLCYPLTNSRKLNESTSTGWIKVKDKSTTNYYSLYYIDLLQNYSENVIMLVLSRNTDESIVIGNDITITVLAIQGDKIRLGIDAPKEIPVHRLEVYQAIVKQQNSQSTMSTS